MLGLVQGGMSLVGGFLGKKSAKEEARRKAAALRAMAGYNAKVKEMEARSVRETMRAETTRAYKSKRQQMASQRAAYSKTGAVSSGTPMAVMLEQATEMEMDIQNQRRNRLLQEQNLRQQAKTSRYEGEMEAQSAIAEGRAAGRASLLGGITGAVGGIGSTLGNIKEIGEGSIGAGIKKLGFKSLLQ
jgi:hypothetical protein